MPNAYSEADVAELLAGDQAQSKPSTEFTAHDVAALTAQPDVPTPDVPLIRKPVQGPITPEAAARQAEDDPALQVDPELLSHDADARLEQILYSAGVGGGTERQAAEYKLAKATGLPLDTISKNFEAIDSAWRNATMAHPASLRPPGSPLLEQPYKTPAQRFRESQPELAQVLLQDPHAGWVTKASEMNVLHKAWNAAADFAFDAPIIGLHNRVPDEIAEEMRNERKVRDTPKLTQVLQDEQAKSMQDGWVDVPTNVMGTWVPVPVPKRALVPFLRGQETWAGLQVSKAYTELAGLEEAGLDTTQKEREIYELERQSVSRDYGEGAVTQIFSDAVTGMVSSGDVAFKGAAGAGVGGAAAGGAAVVAAPFIPEILGGAAAVDVVGTAAFGASWGSKLGASWGTWQLEYGDAYKNMRNATAADGSPAMDLPTARRASAIYATLATGIEFASWGPMFKAMGPLGALLKTGDTKAFTEALIKNPTFMGTVKRLSKNLASTSMAEGGEEALQDATQQAVEYFARSYGQGRFITGNGELDLEQSKEAWGKAIPGGLAGGLLESNIDLVTQHLARDQATVDANKLRALSGLEKSPVATAAPAVVARMLEIHNAQTGAPATHAYIDARSAVRLFQEEGADAGAAMRHLVGEDGAAQLERAAAAGDRLEIPMEQYISKWVPAEVGKRLIGDTAFSRAALTENEAKKVNVEGMAKQLADQVLKADDEYTAASQFDRVEQQLVESGKYSQKEAALSMAPLRALVRTAATTFNIPAAKLFQQYGIAYGAGDEALSVTLGAPADSRYLTKAWLAMPAEQRLRALFIDTRTGALNERAFERMKAAGKLYAAISVEGIKHRNDSAGHEAGNAVYRAGAAAYAKQQPQLFKPGGDFGAFVDSQEQLDEQLGLANADAGLLGYRLEGAVGPSYREAAAENNRRKAAAEAEGRRAPRGTRPLNATGDVHTVEKLQGAEIPAELRAAAEKLSPQQMFEATYVDPSTGLLNHDGFDAAPARAFQLSGDLDGVKEMNTLFGEAVTDRIIALAGSIMRELEGHEASMAHMSGDEFQGKHDGEDHLNAFGSKVQEVLATRLVDITLTPEQQQKSGLPARVVMQGLPFSFGVGKTLDHAETALHADKARREAEGLRGPGKVRERLVRAAEATGEGSRPGAAEGHGDQGTPDNPVRLDRTQERGRRGQDFGRQRFFDAGRLEQGEDHQARLKAARLEAPTDNGKPRGYTDVMASGMERIFRIALNPNSDMSTFLHETGHVFLEVMGDLAERPDAPQRMKDDWAAALKHIGVTARSEIRREHHEKFARSFEAYLMEGHAPSPKLAGAFERFKLWLKKVYRDVKSLGVELNDEIRGVFDRLLATEDEVRRQSIRQGTWKPLAQDLVGMSDEEYAHYKDVLEQRVSHVNQQVDLQVLKARLRENESWWKQEHKEQLEVAKQAYEELPARKAQQYLRGRDTAAGAPIALNRDAVVEAVGAVDAKKLQTRGRGGENPDTLAGLFGYPTGAKMLQDIVGLQDKDKWSKAEATQKMAERYPDVLDDREKLRELVGKGLHGDLTQQWLLKEWEALHRKVSPPGSNVWSTQHAPVETLRAAAKHITDSTKAGRLSPNAYLARERTAAQESARAAAKGDYGTAFAAKQDQLLNMFLWREMTQAKEDREAFLERATKLSKDADGKGGKSNLGKARPIYRDAAVALLEAIGLREPSENERGASIGDLITQMDADGQTIGIDEAALNAIVVTQRGWKDLSVAEMREVDKTLRSIAAAAAGVNTAEYDGKRVDVEELEQKLLDEAAGTSPPQPPLPSSESAKGKWRSFKDWIAGLDGSLLNPEQMIRMYMGESWVRALSDPLQKAKHREADILKGAIKPVVEAFDAMPRSVATHLNDSIDGRALFPEHKVDYDQALDPPSKRFELLVMALNMGTESNVSRLLGGRNITLEQMNAAVQRLTKEEWDWIQSVWDASESLWPMAAELEERDSGLPPERLERRGVDTPHGRYAGGYFPAVYDWRVEQAGQREQAQRVADLVDARYVRPGTAQGHLKSRVEGFTGVISLEAATIKRALAQVAHDIAFREAVKSVGGLLLRPALAAELNKRMGVERADQLLPWAKDVGSMRGLEGAVKAGAWMKLVRFLRGGNTVAVLGYSLTTAAGDFANLLTAMPRSGLEVKHWSAAMLEFMANPRDAMDTATAKSGELRTRREGVIKKLNEQVRDLPKSKFWALQSMRWVQDHAFAFLDGTDMITSAPIWMGAYRQGLAKGLVDAEAVRFADGVLRENFPGQSAVDLPGVLRDKTWLGTTLQFYRYFNVVYNSIRGILDPLRTAEDGAELASRAPRAAGRLLAFMSVSLVLSELLSGRGPEGDEDWGQWYLRKLVFGGLSSVPLLGDLGGIAESKLLHKHINPRGNVVTNFFTQLGDGASKLDPDDPDAEKAAKALMQTFAPILRLPASQPLRTIGGAAAQQDDPARNAAELGSDLYYGRKAGQGKNPLSILGETIEGSPR